MITIIIIVVLVITNITALAVAIRFGKMVLLFEKSIESCLDELDERYAGINKILQTPVFYNSPEIRKVLSEIKDARETILAAANVLSKPSYASRVQAEKDSQDTE